jgi:hypothetical protein
MALLRYKVEAPIPDQDDIGNQEGATRRTRYYFFMDG